MTSSSSERTPIVKELADAFGESVVADDNSLDRKALRSIVFSDKDALLLLD